MTIIEQALTLKDYLAGIHHEIHENPELSLKEFRTTRRIKEEIASIGLAVKEYAPTGLHVDIRGSIPDNGIVVGLRSDIDALPVDENPEASPRSRYEGIMHACGHDANLSMLLGAVKILAARRNEFAGTVRCLFQPAEEIGKGGRLVVDQGACDGVSMFFGMHVAAETPLNAIGYRKGVMGAAVAEFRINIEGKTAPGSSPDRGSDALVASCAIVEALQTIASRRSNPQDPVVVTVSSLQAGDPCVNFIPGKAEIKGNCRFFSTGLSEEMQTWITIIAENTAKAYGVSASVEYDLKVPALFCSEDAVEIALDSAKSVLGEDLDLFEFGPVMASEDFAYLAQSVGGAYLEIGCGADSGMTHSSTFHSSDDCLPYGAAILATEALVALEKISGKGGK